jgi:hypothetical protein
VRIDERFLSPHLETFLERSTQRPSTVAVESRWNRTAQLPPTTAFAYRQGRQLGTLQVVTTKRRGRPRQDLSPEKMAVLEQARRVVDDRVARSKDLERLREAVRSIGRGARILREVAASWKEGSGSGLRSNRCR